MKAANQDDVEFQVLFGGDDDDDDDEDGDEEDDDDEDENDDNEGVIDQDQTDAAVRIMALFRGKLLTKRLSSLLYALLTPL